jgi:hypothetical protein
VGHTAAEIFIILKVKKLSENKFISKVILTHESGSQEDQFDEKNRGKTSRGTIL